MLDHMKIFNVLRFMFYLLQQHVEVTIVSMELVTWQTTANVTQDILVSDVIFVRTVFKTFSLQK